MRRRRTLVETRTKRHARSFDGAYSSYRRGDGGGGGGRRAPRDNLLARALRDRTDDVRRDGDGTPARVSARTLGIELAREARTRVRRDVRRGVQDHRVRESRESRRDARDVRRDAVRSVGSERRRVGGRVRHRRRDRIRDDGSNAPRGGSDETRARANGVVEVARARTPTRGRVLRVRGRLSAVFVRVVDRDAAPSAPAPAEPPQRLRDGHGRLGERTVRSNGERGGKRRARASNSRASRRGAPRSRGVAKSRAVPTARAIVRRASRRETTRPVDARSVATGRSRIRSDVGVASMTRCAEVTGVDVASKAAVVLGRPGWIVRGAYPACGSPRRPHPACGSPRRRDGAGAIFPSMDETTPRPSPIGEGRVRAARRASSSEKASRDAGRGGRGRTRAEACATTSPVGNAKKCREAIACVWEGGGRDAWTPQGLVARGRGVSEKTGISIPRGRGRSRRARGRTRGLARSRRGISRESSSARDRVSANMSSARAAFAGQRASDREPDRVPLGVFFCFRRCRDARDEL